MNEENVQIPARDVKLYTRRDIQDMLGIDHSVLSRWEKRGWIDESVKMSGIAVYTEEQFQKIKQIREQKEGYKTNRGKCSTPGCSRYAREGSTLCSRCSFRQLETNLRDTLPGMERLNDSEDNSGSSNTDITEQSQEIEECPNCHSDDPQEKLTVTTGTPEFPITLPCTNIWHDQGVHNEPFANIPPGSKTYTRRELSDLFDVSPSTIGRWESRGVIPKPYKTIHSNHLVYLDDHVEAIKKYVALIEQHTSPLTQAGRMIGRKSFNKIAERTVASRITFRRGSLF